MAALVAVLGIAANMMTWPAFHPHASGAEGAPVAADLPAGQNTITVNKVDANNQPLEGATLQLLSADSTRLYEEWTSDGNPKVFANIADGKYVIHEVEAPAGYEAAADQAAYVGEQLANTVPALQSGSLEWTDDFEQDSLAFGGHVAYRLNDIGTGTGTLEAYDRFWLSGLRAGRGVTDSAVGNKQRILAALLLGYPNNATGIQGQFGLSDGTFYSLTQAVVWRYAIGTDLQSFKNGSLYADYGAAYDAFVAAVEAAVSDGTVDSRDTSVYMVKQASLPSGYSALNPVVDAEFGTGQYIRSATVNVVNTGSPEPSTVPAPQGENTITVNKVGANNQPLAGARLQLVSPDGTTVYEQWTSDGNPKVIENLADGMYIVREVAAPAGYQPAADQMVYVGQNLRQEPEEITSSLALVTNTLFGLSSEFGTRGVSFGGHAMYCLNHETDLALLARTSLDRQDLMTVDTGNGVTESAAEHRQQILAALLLGYPNNVMRLQQEFDLSDEQFYSVTQAVIYLYANGVGLESTYSSLYSNADTREAYEAMVAAVPIAIESGILFNRSSSVYVEPQPLLTQISRTPIVDAQFGTGEYTRSATVNVVNAPSSVPAADLPRGQGTLRVAKVDENQQTLAGARLQLLNEAGTEVYAEWVSTTAPQVFTNVADGKYLVREVEAPDGYFEGADQVAVLGTLRNEPEIVTGSQTSVTSGWQRSGYSHAMDFGGHVVYCLDQLNSPPMASHGANADNMYTTKLSDPALDMGPTAGRIHANRNKILAALLLGYPNDMKGLQAQTGLSDAQFHRVTQDALWWYSNGLYPGEHDNTAQDPIDRQDPLLMPGYNMFMDAIEEAVANGDIEGYDATIYYWTPDPQTNRAYQPVVDAEFATNVAPDVTVTMTNERGRDLEIRKVWQDASGQTIANPVGMPAVTFDIYAASVGTDIANATASDGALYRTVTLDGSEETPWAKTVSGLPWEINGQAVDYFVLERTADGYSLVSSQYVPGETTQYDTTWTEPVTSTEIVYGPNYRLLDPTAGDCSGSGCSVTVATVKAYPVSSSSGYGFIGIDENGNLIAEAPNVISAEGIDLGGNPQYPVYFGQIAAVPLANAMGDSRYTVSLVPDGSGKFYIKRSDGAGLGYKTGLVGNLPAAAGEHAMAMEWVSETSSGFWRAFTVEKQSDGSFRLLYDVSKPDAYKGTYALVAVQRTGSKEILYGCKVGESSYATGDPSKFRFAQRITPSQTAHTVTNMVEHVVTNTVVEASRFVFTNQLEETAEPRSLRISKSVTGEGAAAAAADVDFVFEVNVGTWDAGANDYVASDSLTWTRQSSDALRCASGDFASGGTVSMRAGETVEISGIVDGDWYYEVVEQPAWGWQAAEASKSGQVAQGRDAEVSFVNSTVPAPSVTFSGLKTLEGKELEAGEFDFELWAADAQGAKTGAGPIETVQNGADGAVAFSEIVYDAQDVATRAGAEAQAVYKYVVVEKIPAEPDPSIDYDDSEWALTVTVNKSTGAVAVTRTVNKSTGAVAVTGDAGLSEGQDFLFENEYDFNAPLTSVNHAGVDGRIVVVLCTLAGGLAGLAVVRRLRRTR